MVHIKKIFKKFIEQRLISLMNIETPEINNSIEKTNKPVEKWTKDMTIHNRENIKALKFIKDILKQDQSKLKLY